MIVRRIQQQLELVTQGDHARFAAELLSLWRADGLPEHPRRADLLLAVREHDNGWREADAAPRADPADGQPTTFLTCPAPLSQEIWRRGIERYAAERPYVALLVAEHALRLHARHRRAAGWRAFMTAVDKRREELLEAAALTPAELEQDYGWLRLVDSLSLVACGAGDAVEVGGRRAAAPSDGELRIDPFPLTAATTFALPHRRVPDRRYAGDADLGGELATARWRERPLRVVPWTATNA